jgi:hypothetical protein
MALHLEGISGRKGIVAGLAVLAVLGIAMLMLHFTLFGAGFTILYIAFVALFAEYINKHYHPGDLVMASIILVGAGIYLLTINYLHIYDFTGFITTTIMSAIVWTAVAEPIASLFKSTHRNVRHYVVEEDNG